MINDYFTQLKSDARKELDAKNRRKSLKIQTANLTKRNTSIRHTLSGSIEFNDFDWKIGVNGVVSTDKGADGANLDMSQLQVRHTIGTGGQSEVKLAYYKGQRYALKVIHLDARKNEYKNTRSEINLLRNLQHNNIVKMKQAFIKNKRICLLCEYMDCASLTRSIASGRGVKDSMLSLLVYQMLLALNYIHKAAVIHRDIKPSNFLFNSMGEVKLTDFGVARYIQEHCTPSLIGTKKYKSPQCLMFEKCNTKCDIWALGLTVAELSLGRFPFSFSNESFVQIVKTKPLIKREDFSIEIFKFIKMCLRKDPKRRPSAQKLLQSDFIKKYSMYEYDMKRQIARWSRDMALKENQSGEMRDDDGDIVMRD